MFEGGKNQIELHERARLSRLLNDEGVVSGLNVHPGQVEPNPKRLAVVDLTGRVRRLLLALYLLAVVCACPAVAAQIQLGKDLPIQWYEDTSGKIDIEQFIAMPPEALTEQRTVLSAGYTKSPVWLRFFLPADLFDGHNRWLLLGPNFIDDITLYYRPSNSSGNWSVRRAGDKWPHAAGDVDYRFPVFILTAPTGAPGYDVVIRVQSSSAVFLGGSVWVPKEFMKEAVRDTAFWSFYFGLAALSTALAVIFAFFLRRPLAWALCAFSLTYWLVACVQGYVDWLFGASIYHWQHYLTGILTLLSYTSLLWVTTEALDLRRRRPGLHRLMMAAIGFSLLLPLSIPLNQYGLAVKIQGVLCIATALIFAAGAWAIWRNEKCDVMTLVLGLMPAIYMATGLAALMSLVGLIPYDRHLHALWQYVIAANMLTVLGWVAARVRQEAREAKERQQLAHELRRERAASFYQRQFISMVSHEFRNPLAVISNALENLQLPSISGEQRERRYQSIRRATDRLVQLTDNCLADSRLEADGFQLQMSLIDVVDLVRSAAEVVDGSKEHRWRLTVNGQAVDKQAGHEAMLRADPALLRIAVSNILDNAVKYSDKGDVDIDVTLRNERAVISIRDHGLGIPPEDASLIFERHRRRQMPSMARRDPGGAGLGLYVSRHIARAHGGELNLVQSGPEGSCFELSVPMSAKSASV